MDAARFQEAQQAYDAGDFRTAAKTFLSAAGEGGAGSGAAFHMAGNSLMRLRRYRDAVTVYGHALADEGYEKRGAVRANLGQAYLAAGDYSDAIDAFLGAIEEPDYSAAYKARQGLAGALLETGRTEEAAAAYRAAALDPENPDPGKALVNLGLCFMALGRPEDASEAYKAALGFDGYEGRGKALANLGQAFAASGRYDDAVRAFRRAEEVHGYQLSEAAAAAYEIAKLSASESVPTRVTVEGWETGELTVGEIAALAASNGSTVVEEAEGALAEAAATETPSQTGAAEDRSPAVESATPVSKTPPAAPEGWSTAELQGMTGVESPRDSTTVQEPEAEPLGVTEKDAEQAAAELGFGDEAAVSEFFSLTEQEMKTRDREARSAERAAASGKSRLRVAIAALVTAGVVIALLAAAWSSGLGWPTQSQTVNGLLQARSGGEPVDRYWVAVPDADVDKEMAKIPPVKEFEIDEVERDSAESVVLVTVTPEEGAPLRYSVTLAREGVGWKVSGVDNDWRSTDETASP